MSQVANHIRGSACTVSCHVLTDVYAGFSAGLSPIPLAEVVDASGLPPVALAKLFDASSPSCPPPMLNDLPVATAGKLPTGAGGHDSTSAHTSGMHHCTDCSSALQQQLEVLSLDVRLLRTHAAGVTGDFSLGCCSWHTHARTQFQS